MGFSLTIQEGKDLGKQFSFDQPEVSIGRTAENDVVLYDPGVSRKHVVIRTEGGRFFVQDQGSANGTQVNGNSVTEEELQAGDLVSVGPVVFSFELAAEDGANSTRIVDPADIKPRKALARSSPAQLKATGPMAANKRPAPLARPAGRPAPIGRPKPQAGAGGMLASERARMRRENAGALGRLKLFFIEAPKPVRFGIMGVVAVLFLGGFGLVVKSIAGSGGNVGVDVARDRSRETFKISENPSNDVYGIGDDFGVTIPTKDEVHFQFEYAESIPVVYYVKFEAFGVERKEQVDITLNGVHIAYAAPSIGDFTKAQKVRLPKKHLKAGIPNELVFDEADNPPNMVPWAISKAKLIIKPLPQCVAEECVREAKKLYDLADNRLSMKDIASANRFDAWAALHRALLFLEAVDPKPDLYGLVQATLRDVDRDLDGICNKIMLTAKKSEELRDGKRALKEYKDGLTWFPAAEDEHPCRGRLKEKIDEYGEARPGE